MVFLPDKQHLGCHLSEICTTEYLELEMNLNQIITNHFDLFLTLLEF